MTKDSKERVRTDKLKKFRQAQQKLMAPLPARLKRVARPVAVEALGRKFRQLPEFVAFEPLEMADWKPLDGNTAPQQAPVDEQQRLAQAIRYKIRDQQKIGAALDKRSNKIPDGYSPESRHGKERGLESIPAGSTGGSKRNFGAAKSRTARGQGAKKQAPRFKPEAAGKKKISRAVRKDTSQILGALLGKISDLDRTLDPTPTADPLLEKPEKRSSPSLAAAEKSQKPGMKNKPQPELKEKKPGFAPLRDVSPGIGKRKKSRPINSPPLAAAKKTAKEKINGRIGLAKQPDTLAMLSDLIESLWNRQTRSRRAGVEVSPAPAGLPEPSLAPQTAAAAPRPVAVSGDEPAQTPHAVAEPERRAPSLHQAEELAEQINRVIREQAWLRGVNLP